jgi:Enoyl-(Acyl carrier protein) reductase
VPSFPARTRCATSRPRSASSRHLRQLCPPDPPLPGRRTGWHRQGPGTACYGKPARPPAAGAARAAKWSLIGLTKSAALEYVTDSIRINAICPGIIDTRVIGRVSGATDEGYAELAVYEPIGRMGTPEEIASACNGCARTPVRSPSATPWSSTAAKQSADDLLRYNPGITSRRELERDHIEDRPAWHCTPFGALARIALLITPARLRTGTKASNYVTVHK